MKILFLITLLLKVVVSIFIFLITLYTTGFCFDTGTDLQISCKVLMVIFSYLIFLYLLWDNEIITYCQTHSAKQILTISLILIVVILIASCLLTLGTTNTEYNL